MSFAIEVTDLTRRFGAFTAVDSVSFQVETGEIFGYLGANGAGKSTTIRMLCGLLLPTSGDAVVAGHRVSRSPEKIKRVIGYMSQKFSLYKDLTVLENLDFYGGAYGIGGQALARRVDEVLELTGLQDYRQALTGDLPGGTRQRVALANSILHEPGIVFLDEPTAGVDPAARRDFWKLIRHLALAGTTVFVTTHYMDEAEYCARIGLMVAGRLAALDTPEALKRDYVPGRLFAVEGVSVGVVRTLQELPGFLEALPFGAGVHLRFASDAPVSVDSLKRGLVAAGARVHVEEAEPSLEDVFLAVAGGGGGGS